MRSRTTYKVAVSLTALLGLACNAGLEDLEENTGGAVVATPSPAPSPVPPPPADTDEDGLLDTFETLLGTDPAKTDSDADEIGDACEVAHLKDGLNPSRKDATPNSSEAYQINAPVSELVLHDQTWQVPSASHLLIQALHLKVEKYCADGAVGIEAEYPDGSRNQVWYGRMRYAYEETEIHAGASGAARMFLVSYDCATSVNARRFDYGQIIFEDCRK